MHKRIPFYYIVTLWTVAIVSVFLIVKPLLLLFTDNSNVAGFADINQQLETNQEYTFEAALLKERNRNSGKNTNDDSDLIFYNKTAFIRYFSDKYSQEELAVSYNKAVKEKASGEEKGPVRVIRKNTDEYAKISFSGGFDIRPVPVSNK